MYVALLHTERDMVYYLFKFLKIIIITLYIYFVTENLSYIKKL
jgi:hypothetical protein